MPDTRRLNDASVLFFIPSFYGAFTWGTWLVLYFMNLVRIDDCSYTALVIFLLVEIMFLLSLLYSLPAYRQCLEARNVIVPQFSTGLSSSKFSMHLLLLFLHAIGVVGLVKYYIDISKAMGGAWWFMFALMNEASQIREETGLTTSIGTQIAYPGWIAISLTTYWVSGKKISKWWLVPAALQLIGNLAYLDRMKPIMILVTSLLMLLPLSIHRISFRKIAIWMTAAMALTVLTFWGVAEWAGKTFYKSAAESGALPGITYDLYTYGASGFAYFNKLLEINTEISYLPVRIFYPLLKFTAKYELTLPPPDQRLEFHYIPFSTNIGTFLEPYYSDGGLTFVILGILFFSFGLNAFGLYLLRANTPLSDYAWANVCLVLILAFIANKMTTFPLWLFCGIGILSAMIARQNSYFRKIKATSENLDSRCIDT